MKAWNPRALLANLAKVFLALVGLGAASVKIWYQSSLAELIPLGFSLVLLSVAAFGMQWSTNAEEFASLPERRRVYCGSRDCFLACILSLVSSAFVVFPKSFPLYSVLAQPFYVVHTLFFAMSMLIALWGLSKLLDASISHR
jgi:hypothetical protein